MKRFGPSILVAIAVALFSGVTPASATPITYTMTSTASGTIGGSAFTNALVSVTLTGDTSNIAALGLDTLLVNPGAATIFIAGHGTAAFTDSVEVISSHNSILGSPFPDQPFVVIATLDDPADPTSITGVLIASDSALFGYDLQTPIGLISGSGGAASGPLGVHHTTLGDLFFSFPASSQIATFTTTVPEPSSLALLGTGLFALIGARFGKRR